MECGHGTQEKRECGRKYGHSCDRVAFEKDTMMHHLPPNFKMCEFTNGPLILLFYFMDNNENFFNLIFF
jgi:hypothetical protein